MSDNVISVELIEYDGKTWERTVLKSGAIIDTEQVPPRPPPIYYKMADLKKDIDLIKGALGIE